MFANCHSACTFPHSIDNRVFRFSYPLSERSEMTEIKTAPYGSWKSPITSDLIVKESIGLSQVKLDGDDIYWIEMRPSEGGRQVIVRLSTGDGPADVTQREFNARTLVHEYGGGDFAVHNRVVYFSNFADQQLYRQGPNSIVESITEKGGQDRKSTRLNSSHSSISY